MQKYLPSYNKKQTKIKTTHYIKLTQYWKNTQMQAHTYKRQKNSQYKQTVKF